MRAEERHYYMSLIDQAYYVTKLKINNSLKLLTKSMDDNPANFDLEYKNLNLCVEKFHEEEE
jgi:hypothetical protein